MDSQTFMDWLNTGNSIAMDWYGLTHPEAVSGVGVGVNVGPRGVNVQAGGTTLILFAVLAFLILKD